MKKLVSILTALTLLATPVVASAHVVVTPNTALTGQELVFSVSAPNERKVAVTSVTLDIPAGVSQVIPTTAPGWSITLATSYGAITAVTWTDGQIPAGQRQDFSLSAVMPANSGELNWKAYQTYADGTIVSWDQKPVANAKDDDTAAKGPYSTTTVSSNAPGATKSGGTTLPLALSVAALALSALAFLRRRSR